MRYYYSYGSRPPLGVALAIWIAFIAYLFWVCPHYQLHCRRTADQTMEVKVRKQLLGWGISERTFAGIQSVRLQMNPRQGEDGPGWRQERTHRSHQRGANFVYDETSRILFTNPTGEVPMTPGFASGLERHQALVEALNRFLTVESSSTTSLRLPQHWAVWVGAVLLGFVSVGLAFGRR